MTRHDLEDYILETYHITPDYPWAKSPEYAVFRHSNNKKWFALIMNISKDKLGLDTDEVLDVVNLKCESALIDVLLGKDGFFPAYHMNKTMWITVALDGSAVKEEIKSLIDMSFELTASKH